MNLKWAPRERQVAKKLTNFYIIGVKTQEAGVKQEMFYRVWRNVCAK
jgi:hypothetical protein